MALAAPSSAATLDPSTLPQVCFARADDLLSHAAQLRAKVEALKTRAIDIEDNAERLEEAAAELQANAEDDREYVQAELDTTLEYHCDVLEDFLQIPDHEKEFKKLTTSVEEGTTYVHEVVALGERLLQFKAAKLHLSQSNEVNSSRNSSKVESNVTSSSQTPVQSQAPLQAQYALAMGTAPWRYRIDSLLGRRASDVDHSAHSSLIKPDTGGGPVEAHNDINGSPDKVETHGGHDHETRSVTEGPRSRCNTSANSTLNKVLQNATLPVTGQNATLEAGIESQNKRKKTKKSSTAEGTANSSQDTYQSHVEEDFISLEPSGTSASTSEKLKRKKPCFDSPTPDAKRRMKLLEPTEKERAAAYNGKTALPRFHKLFARESGTNEVKSGKAKKMLKQEMKKKAKKSSKISRERKERLIDYGHKQINALVKRENKRRRNAILKEDNEHGGDADLQDLYTTNLVDKSPDEAVAKEQSEGGEDGQLTDFYTAELLEESADDTWWP